MKVSRNEFTVDNIFSDINEAKRKEKVNKAIKNLCILDIEKMSDLDYNISIVSQSKASDLEKGGEL